MSKESWKVLEIEEKQVLVRKIVVAKYLQMAFEFVATGVRSFDELDTYDASSISLECIMQVEVVETWFTDFCLWCYHEEELIWLISTFES